MKRDKREDRDRIRREAKGMKEDELIFNNVRSWKPFLFQPSEAINNRAREIKWLWLSVYECVFLILCVCKQENKWRWEVRGKQRVRDI